MAGASSQHQGLEVVELAYGSKSQSMSSGADGITSATFCWVQESSKVPKEGTYTVVVVVVILTLVFSD